MKIFFTWLMMLSTVSAFAYEVGDTAACVVLDGFTSTGASHMGCIRDHEKKEHKYTVLEFAMTTCESCTLSMPHVNWLADCMEKATIRTVYADKKDDVVAFLKAQKDPIHFATAIDANKKATRTYGVELLPTTYVLDARNKVVFKHEGELTQEIAEEIARLFQ